MKKTRLLEIVREEIAFALNEFYPTEYQDQQGFDTHEQLEEEQPSKYKKLAEKYQLDEDTINEMASLVQTKKALTKLGDEKGLELVKDVEKETLDQFRKNPIMIGGRLARKLEPEEKTGKKDTRGFGADFERNFEKKAGIDFKEFTMDIEIKHNKQFPGDKPFNSGLATNTTEKDAAAQIFGIEKSKPGPKVDPNKPKKEKPESTGKKGRPAGTKTATRTPGADGFDDVSYSDEEVEDTYYKDEDEFTSPSEEGPSSEEITGDKTAKELAQASPASKDENFDRIRTGLMNKVKKAKGELSAEDKKLAIQIINSAKEKYKFNTVQVDALRAVAGL